MYKILILIGSTLTLVLVIENFIMMGMGYTLIWMTPVWVSLLFCALAGFLVGVGFHGLTSSKYTPDDDSY